MARTAGVVSALILACLSVYCFVQYFQSNGLAPTFALVTFLVSAIYGALIGLDEGKILSSTHVNVIQYLLYSRRFWR